MSVDRDPTSEELERTAGQAWFVGGIFVGFGASPVFGVVIYAVASLFFERSLSVLIVLMAAVLSLAVGLAYVALARTLEG